MIVHRFMSREEYIKLMTGQQLVNHSKHEGNRTKAVGFCFTQDNPDKAIHYLSGCVDTDVCLTFDFPAERLKPVKAIYRDYEHDDKLMTRPIIPYNYDDIPTMEKTEYCTTSYDISMCRVINVTTKYNVVPSRRDFEQVIKVLHGENQMRFEIELMSNPKYRRG